LFCFLFFFVWSWTKTSANQTLVNETLNKKARWCYWIYNLEWK
jgi:hypothetical protein